VHGHPRGFDGDRDVGPHAPILPTASGQIQRRRNFPDRAASYRRARCARDAPTVVYRPRMSSRAFQDRTVVITGASAGIGLSCARQFAEAGANVVMVARGAAGLERATAELERIGPTLAIAADVAHPDAPETIVSGALARFGGLHVLVNNAGMHARGSFADQNGNALAAMVDVNLRAPIALTHRALPHLIASGQGAIVNVASLAGKLPTVGSAVY